MRTLTTVVTALLVLASAGCPLRPKRPPNIILVVVDTLRADHLGAYGFEGGISPHLDRLATESLLFENCFSQAPWTPPSMGSLFTSLYPRAHGLNFFRDQGFKDTETGKIRMRALPESAVTLAESLRDAGYRTAAFVTNPWLERQFGLLQGFELGHDRFTGGDVRAGAIKIPALHWLQSGPDDTPFFLFLHFMDVHGPWNAPKQDFDALRDNAGPGGDRILLDSELPSEGAERRPNWASEQMRREMGYWTTRYASGVRAFDRRFAEYLRFMEEQGILDDAYLVLTSDHGEELYENGRWGHGNSLFEHQLHVPLLVRKPGGDDGGGRIPGMMGLIDLMPTLLSLAGVQRPDSLQGTDVSRWLEGKAAERRPVFFASSVMWGPDVYSVRTERHKLITTLSANKTQLFDLDKDPGERQDIGAEEEALLGAMNDLLDAHLQATSHGSHEVETREIEEGALDRLRSLGYLK